MDEDIDDAINYGSDSPMGCFLVLLGILIVVCLIAQGCHCEPKTYPPLNELNPNARYVIIDDDEGNHIKFDKTQIKAIWAEGSSIYVNYGSCRNCTWHVEYPEDYRRREMYTRILRWWKQG